MKTVILILLATVIHARSASVGVLAGSPPTGFAPESIAFAGGRMAFGSSAVLLAEGGKFTASFWVLPTSVTGAMQFLGGRSGGSGSLWRVRMNGTALEFLFQNATPATVVVGAIAGIFTVNSWKHILISFDTASTANRAVYVNDVAQTVSWTTYSVGSTLALNRTDFFVGNDDGMGSDLLGCMAEVWVDDDYNDLSNATFRHSFISGGNPVDLGPTGALPTGAAPDLYMKFVAGSLGVNSGADGGTAVNGTPTSVGGDCGTVVAE